VKLAERGVEGFLRRPDPSARLVLLYGADLGLVRERAARLAATVVSDLGDPFRVAEMSAESIQRDPPRLGDEAAALALTGGRRVVWIRDAGDALADIVGDFLGDPRGDALIVVEGGELARRSRLVQVVEASNLAVAIGCYPDDSEGLERLIREALDAAGFDVDADALAYLIDRLGSDRQVSRRELEKLTVYAKGKARIDLADARACIGDSADFGIDDLVSATVEGDVDEVIRGLTRLSHEGAAAATVMRALQRHVQRLHLVQCRMAGGGTVRDAVRTLRPPVYFRLASSLEAAAPRWPTGTTRAAMVQLCDAEIRIKSTGTPDFAVLGQTATGLARLGQRFAGAPRIKI
jgi:DNA polymerase-3 subunit delta